MHDDQLRQHIAALGARTDAETQRLGVHIARTWWPGGADRTLPAALAWVRRWRPERLGAALPACSCAGGRCPVCN